MLDEPRLTCFVQCKCHVYSCCLIVSTILVCFLSCFIGILFTSETYYTSLFVQLTCCLLASVTGLFTQILCLSCCLRLPALMDLYINPLYVLVSKILSSILKSPALIHPLYHPLSTLSTVGPTCYFI
jgi:hypothetical protein